jgi:hypothetical protein
MSVYKRVVLIRIIAPSAPSWAIFFMGFTRIRTRDINPMGSGRRTLVSDSAFNDDLQVEKAARIYWW